MNGWRDMKTSPPDHGEAVIATDGAGSMWAGRVERVDALPDLDKVVGANLHTGKPVQIYFDELTGWIPVSEKFESEKTADQRLLELGYRKNLSVCYGEDKGKLLYEKPVMEGTDIFEVAFNNGQVLFTDTAGYSVWMDSELAAAISAKCKEMGWADKS